MRVNESRIRELIAQTGMGVGEFCDVTGTNRRTLYKLFHGQVFRSSSLEKLASVLGVSPESLLAGVKQDQEPERTVVP